ncbi:MAG: helix-turn-helix domain-containing protein, partial [Fimbriimonadaceae bacterium]
THLPANHGAPVLEASFSAFDGNSTEANHHDFEPKENHMNDSLDQAPVDMLGGQQTAVKLELLLTPDQLSNLFRAVAANQHTLWTVRDAASYLRISGSALEAMADKGEIPAFKVDGRWRFAKTTIDEWLQYSQISKEAA